MALLDNLLGVFCLLGALQGLLLGVAVGTLGDGPRRARRLLSLILLASATVLVVILQSHRSPAGTATILETVEHTLWLFAGPLAYLYVTLAMTDDRADLHSFLPHLTPAVAWLGYLGLFHAGAVGGEVPWRPPAAWLMLYQMLYTALSIWRWRRAAAGGPPAGIHAFWVPALIVVLLVQHGAQLVRYGWRQVDALRDVVPLAGAGSFVVISFLGLREALPLLARVRRRYAGSTLSSERADQIAGQLAEALERERLYLRPDLTLGELATRLGVAKTHLSQVINERFEQSFSELLGRYRLRESERLLADESVAHLTIEAIARRSGFNSRSAFYQTFRRHHGLTPSDFRRQSSESTVAGADPGRSYR